jgi:hypothetical protein
VSAVPVTSTLVELLNAPRQTLLKVARGVGLELPRDARKWDAARALARVFRDEIPEEAAKYVYAGQRSISWIRLVPEEEEFALGDPQMTYPLRGLPLELSDIEDVLASEFQREDPFDVEDRPEKIMEGEPQLIVARRREDGILLLFAIAQRKGQVIHNFEATSLIEDEFFPVILRPELGLLEVRASTGEVRRLTRTWLRRFAAALGAQAVPVSIPYSDLQHLHGELEGKLDVYTGAETQGTSIYETHRFTRDEETCDDLLKEQRFAEDTAQLLPLNGDILFEFPPEFPEVRVHVSCNNGSIWIRTAVPEEVILYVREAMERVKGL